MGWCNVFIYLVALQQVSALKWLGITRLWRGVGVATVCTAAAKDYYSLFAARISWTLSRPPSPPALMLISSHWYTKFEQAPRYSV